MRTARILRIITVLVFVFATFPAVSWSGQVIPQGVRQVRPNPAPPRPKNFDELVNQYDRLKASNATNIQLANVIRNASSFKEARVVEWLKRIYQTEKDQYVRQTAISTIGNMQINTPDVLKWLRGVFENEKNNSLRQSAVSALGSVGTKEAANELLEIYEKFKKGGTPDANVLRYVTQALTRVAQYLPLRLLVDLMEDASGYDRANIARAIGKLGTKEAISILIEKIVLDEKDPNSANLSERYRISSVISEIARDSKDEAIVTWLLEEILASRKTSEAARIALLKGFTDRSRNYARYQKRQEELEEQRLKQEEARKKAEEAAKNDPNAVPPPAPPRMPVGTPVTPPKPISLAKITGLLDDRSAVVRGAAATLLGESGDLSMAKVLIGHLDEKDQDALLRVIFALGELKAREALEPLLDLLGKAKWEIKAGVIDALGKIGEPELVEPLTKYLTDRRWQVRAAAVQALSRIRCKESVTALIERMKKEKGRLLSDIARALEKLTALELGSDPKAWEDWWKIAKDRYVLPKEVSRSPETANPGVVAGPKTELTPTYHGIEVLSHRICFIIDISGSMSSQMQNQGQGQGRPGQPGSPGSPGTADPSKKKEESKKEPIFKGQKKRVQPKDNSKIEFAKAELVNCLIALNPKVRFNIISFESKVNPWQSKLVPASRDNKKKAIAWTNAMKPTGATNLGDAILLAFEDKEVDTIFVLSDGQPNQGKLPSPDAILAEVRRLNTARRIVIHTINFHGSKDFMRKLAEENGGSFVDY